MNESIASSMLKPSRIVLKQSRDATKEAGKIVESARMQAQRVLDQANRDSVFLREKARMEGVSLGKQEAMAIIMKAISFRKSVEMSAESDIASLCIGVIKKIISVHKKEHREWVIERVRQGLQCLQDQRVVRVRVNSDDLMRFRQQLNEVAAVGTLEGVVTLVGDDELEPGDCIFESPAVMIEATVRGCLEAVTESLMESVNLNNMKGDVYESNNSNEQNRYESGISAGRSNGQPNAGNFG